MNAVKKLPEVSTIISVKKIIWHKSMFFWSRLYLHTISFQKSPCFSGSMFNPILCIYPLSIKYVHQDLLFKWGKFAENKSDLTKFHVQHGHHAFINQVELMHSIRLISRDISLWWWTQVHAASHIQSVIRQKYHVWMEIGYLTQLILSVAPAPVKSDKVGRHLLPPYFFSTSFSL